MEALYQEVLTALQAENKEQAVTLCINALKEERLTVAELYEMILVPALASVVDEYQEDEQLIWREHVRSAIIRTIIESAYPFILKERKSTPEPKAKVVVMCPEFEDHELGAKMVADFFQIEGYDTTFIGARTPEKTILQAIAIIKPKYVCISVTNYYNLISVKKTIDTIRREIAGDFTFVLGGNAIAANAEMYKTVGADLQLSNYEDIKNLEKEGA